MTDYNLSNFRYKYNKCLNYLMNTIDRDKIQKIWFYFVLMSEHWNVPLRLSITYNVRS